MNLRSLARKINSPMLFAHVRAATPGYAIDEQNCHPFVHGKLTWMHNGMALGFKKIRRKLLRDLKDDAYDAIQGSTASEHLFGLYLNQLDNPTGSVTTEEMVGAMTGMFAQLDGLLLEHDVKEHSYLNLCVSNGKAVIATRYTTNPRVQPATLYFMFGRNYACDEYRCYMEPDEGTSEAVIIASEPFTSVKSDWVKVGRNSMIIVEEDLSIRFQDIEMSFERAGFVYQ